MIIAYNHAMATILGSEPSPSLRHRPRQRTLAGLFDAISYSIDSPAQAMRVHTNLESDADYDSRTIILKDINALQVFDDEACSRIVINIQRAKMETCSKAAVNILYTLGEINAPLQASSGYSLKRYVRDQHTAYFIQKHPL